MFKGRKKSKARSPEEVLKAKAREMMLKRVRNKAARLEQQRRRLRQVNICANPECGRQLHAYYTAFIGDSKVKLCDPCYEDHIRRSARGDVDMSAPTKVRVERKKLTV